METLRLDPDTMHKISKIIIDIAYRTKNRKQEIIAWKILNKINQIEGQPRHIDGYELLLMKTLHDNYISYGDLAFIFNRSKSSIHAKMKDCPPSDELLERMKD